MRSLHCSHCDEVHALAVAYYPDQARATERQVCYGPGLATVVQGDVVPSI
ncbi:MAG: hypothetical protein KJ792_02815 [Actinobacteria bacterium]|nr:hypothetical protein [Actinomycetota bacterium]MCG2800806.1 hypothetical protein [Cellulomonas sp.]